jgi:hypothetical protein
MIETREELKLSPNILSVLRNEFVVEPPVQFSGDLMASIQPAPKKIPDPINRRKFWLVIAGIAASIFMVVLINSHSSLTHLYDNPYFKTSILNLAAATSGIIKFAGSFFTYLIPLSILLAGDYYFRTRRSQSIAGE